MRNSLIRFLSCGNTQRLLWIVSAAAVIPMVATPTAATQRSTAQRPAAQRSIAQRTTASFHDGAEAFAPAIAQLDLEPGDSLTLPSYRPEQNGFQFSNRELTQAITGNRDRPEWLSTFTLSLPELFGTQVCVGEDVGQDGKKCILTAAAQNWLASQIELMEQGVCDAIAATSLFLWQPNVQPRLPWWQTLLGALIPLNQPQITASNDVLQTWVANQALLQTLDEVYRPTQRVRETFSPTEILAEIAQAFRDTPENPYTLGVYRQAGSQLVEGHSLLPYGIEAVAENQYRVYVYDSNLPDDGAAAYVLFDVAAETWTYEPTGAPAYGGDGQSQNLDLTQLSWRRPPAPAATVAAPDPSTASAMASLGPFTCPFCQTEASAESMEIALVGEGHLQVEQFEVATGQYVPLGQSADRVPFKGGLDREVPTRYIVAAEGSDRPYKVTLANRQDQPQENLALQVVGSGYTASFEALTLAPGATLVMYVAATATGPELTFEAQQATTIPQIAIYLEDDYTESPAIATASAPQADESLRSETVQQSKHVSYSFKISDISLPAGRSVGLTAHRQLQRFYFADNDAATNRYTLKIVGRTREERTSQTETREDFPNGEFEIQTRTDKRTRRYEESLQITNVTVDNQLAYFDYGDWAQIPTDEDDLFNQQVGVDVPIVYNASAPTSAPAGSLLLKPKTTATQTRVYRGNLIKSNYR